MVNPSIGSRLMEFFGGDPLMAVAIVVALVALGTTPLAFLVLGRSKWFVARRGRVQRRPEFWSVVCSMMLVMGVPAVFMAIVLKSRSFDKDRYEFDPNRTLSVLDRGSQFEGLNRIEALKKADEAVRLEMKRLAEERKNLVNTVKKLDESMLILREATRQAPAVGQTLPAVLESLAGVRRSVGLDGPQQLMDFTAPPAALAGAPTTPTSTSTVPATMMPATAAAPPATTGLAPDVAASLAAVPAPQKPLADMLPLADLTTGWTLGTGMGPNGKQRFETFNAANLFEKIDGRAESFVQFDVQGMAYTYYHPVGDESSEAQLYIFELKDALKALGKYGSEKPEKADSVDLGSEGYTAGGSVFFYSGKYYTQIVLAKNDPLPSAFALELAKRVAAKQKIEPSAGGGPKVVGPEDVLALLPKGPGKANPKFTAQDVFGYSFLSDVFQADYKEGDLAWQGFLRPYETPEAARKVFEQYLESAKRDGVPITEVKGAEADAMIVAANMTVDYVDAIFLKGNALGGVNGVNGVKNTKTAEDFARAFAKSLPAKVPVIPADKKTTPAGEGDGVEK